MIKLIISGCCGRMGRALASLCNENSNIEIVAGFDIVENPNLAFPVFKNPAEFIGEADVLVDFSNSNALSSLLQYCVERKLPAVFCTTGYSDEQLSCIDNASKVIPIFRSGNMSLGINVLCELVKRAAHALGEDFDIEIVEKHHRNKLDAPSGTALMLADAASESRAEETRYIYERNSRRAVRGKSEIGISSIRGGTIVGEHDVIFAGFNEVITLSHSCSSREVFATGALRAAIYLAKVKSPGMYDMSSMLAETNL